MYKKAGMTIVLLSGMVTAAWGQVSIYRCGNEYTNNARQAKERGCKAVEGGHVTVIHGGGGVAPAVSAPAAPQRPMPPRAESSEQKARDGDAKAILQAELDKANARLAALKVEFNEGNPDRTALELRNPQHYITRVDELKTSIARQEGDIAGIQRELGRLP